MSTLLNSQALTQYALWELDPAHSTVSFSVRHMMIAKVHGGFTKLSGTLKLDRGDPTKSSVEASIDVSSVDTRDPKRDELLRSADFLDAEKYPSIHFNSKAVRQDGKELEVLGELTLHGVKREVTLDVKGLDSERTDLTGNVRIGASATAKIKRRDFGLNWNAAVEAGGVLVGDEVSVTLDIQFLKK